MLVGRMMLREADPVRRLAAVCQSVFLSEHHQRFKEQIQRLSCLLPQEVYRIQFIRNESADSTPSTSNNALKEAMMSSWSSRYMS